MAEHRLIFNAKGVQLGYLEGNAAFDLSGRQRCNYDGASGNLFDSNNERAIGHISLDGTFVGASWISEDLFGKPTGEASANRPTGMHGVSRRNTSSAKRSDALPAPSGLEQSVENPAKYDLKPDNECEAPLGSPEISNELAEGLASDRAPEPSGSAESSPPADELLSRAIGMIRDALAKEPHD
jgi:hypothetical protein